MPACIGLVVILHDVPMHVACPWCCHSDPVVSPSLNCCCCKSPDVDTAKFLRWRPFLVMYLSNAGIYSLCVEFSSISWSSVLRLLISASEMASARGCGFVMAYVQNYKEVGARRDTVFRSFVSHVRVSRTHIIHYVVIKLLKSGLLATCYQENCYQECAEQLHSY